MSRRYKRDRDVGLLVEFFEVASRLSPQQFLKVLVGIALHFIGAALILQAACYSLEDFRILDWILAAIKWFAGETP